MISQWKYHTVGTMNNLAAAYAKFSSVTVMLLDLGLGILCFSTLLHNARLTTRLNCSVDSLVRNANCI